MIIKVSDIPQPTLFAAGRFFQLKKVKGAQVKGAGNSIKYKKPILTSHSLRESMARRSLP